MKIALVGWGLETQSAFHYYGTEKNSYVIVNEEPRTDYPSGSNIELHTLSQARKPGLAGNVEDLSYLDHILESDLVVYQPSAHKNMEKHFGVDHPLWKKAKTIQHIFFENCRSKNIIGVTGTKGKGTTSTLIARLLEADGRKVHLGGNIGVPLLDFINDIKQDDWVVLELSSFQLYKFPYSPHIAVHLMMMPEHIEEWHKTMDDYVGAKRNIVSHQSTSDITIYNANNSYSAENATYSTGKKIPYMAKPGAYVHENYIYVGDVQICKTSDIKLLGAHNLQNICAALTAVWNVHQNIEAIRSILTSFSGLEHRLELAGTVGGVRYYDDSFGTTPDTAVVALDAFSEQKVIIVGGHDKGNDYAELAKRLCQKDIRAVIFIGTTAKKIYDLALKEGIDPQKVTIKEDGNAWTMREIVEVAQSHAQAGDVVLLSTGSASFGLFKDYKDRGNQFKQCVKELELK